MYATEYVKQREAFGKTIADFQGIRWEIAKCATEIEAARLLTYRAACLSDQGKFSKEHVPMLSMAKYYASAAFYTTICGGTEGWIASSAPSVTGNFQLTWWPKMTRSWAPTNRALDVDDRTGQRARDAGDFLNGADDELAEIIDTSRLAANDDVVGSGDLKGLQHARYGAGGEDDLFA
jgi:hypothetical protein